MNIQDLITKPIIRSDKPFEFLNKMTDLEIKDWCDEIEIKMIKEDVEKSFPQWNASLMSHYIDTDILYNILLCSKS